MSFQAIVIIGGVLNDDKPTSRAHIYYPGQEIWETLAPFPFEMRGALAVSAKGILTVFNGEFANGSYSKNVYQYDWNNGGSWFQKLVVVAQDIKPKVILPYNY